MDFLLELSEKEDKVKLDNLVSPRKVIQTVVVNKYTMNHKTCYIIWDYNNSVSSWAYYTMY